MDREVELGRLRVGRHDRGGLGERGALHHVEADSSAAEHDHGRRRGDLRRVQHGTDAGDHAAREQRCRRPPGCPRRSARSEMRAPPPARRRPRCACRGRSVRPSASVSGVSSSSANRLAARHLGAALAARALAARTDQRDDDPFADVESDAVADLDDLPGRLVSPHGREVAAPLAVGVRHVAVADRHGVDSDPHLAGPGVGQRQRLRSSEGSTELPADRGADRGGHSEARLPDHQDEADDEAEMGDAGAGRELRRRPTRWCR